MITGALDLSVKPLMEHLGITEYVTNRLEFVNGMATGRLLPPVMAAATKASWIRTYTEREGISLSDSYAYTDSMSDLPMLSIVGHPAVINPDMRLRQTALHHDWPILKSEINPCNRWLKTDGTSTPTKDTRIRNLHRSRQRAAHHAVRRRLHPRRLADRNARSLPESVDQRSARIAKLPFVTHSITRSAAIRCLRNSSRECA